jgi:hypothetical protein
MKRKTLKPAIACTGLTCWVFYCQNAGYRYSRWRDYAWRSVSSGAQDPDPRSGLKLPRRVPGAEPSRRRMHKKASP